MYKLIKTALQLASTCGEIAVLKIRKPLVYAAGQVVKDKAEQATDLGLLIDALIIRKAALAKCQYGFFRMEADKIWKQL